MGKSPCPEATGDEPTGSKPKPIESIHLRNRLLTTAKTWEGVFTQRDGLLGSSNTATTTRNVHSVCLLA